ncbi:hypothetical protein EBQ91_03180, partial [bacterium]|nr:hypothetical protein [bacterium]
MFFPTLNQYVDQRVVQLGHCHSTSFFLAAADLIALNDQVCFVTENPAQALLLYDYLKTIRSDCLLLPDWELMPYDTFKVSQDIAVARNIAFYNMMSSSKWVVITSLPAIIYQLPPKEFYLQHALVLKKGQHLVRDDFVDRLTHYGYQRTMQVNAPCEFAVRGSVVDLYLPSLDNPVRLSLYDDHLESLRYFDPFTQKTVSVTEEIMYVPAHEYPVDEIHLQRYLKNFRGRFDTRQGMFYSQLSDCKIPPGFSFFLPLVFETQLSFIDYLSERSLLVFPEQARSLYDDIQKKAQERFSVASIAFGFEPFKPEEILIAASAFNSKINRPYRILTFTAESKAGRNLPVRVLQPFTQQPWIALKETVHLQGGRWLFTFESLARSQLLVQKIEHLLGSVKEFHSINDFVNDTAQFGWMLASFEQAIFLTQSDYTILPEAHLYNQKVTARTRVSSASSLSAAGFAHSSELDEGQLIVHFQHGIGRYLGLKLIELGSIKKEMLELQYADGDKLFVPLSDIGLLSPYLSIDPDTVDLHKLGQSKWQKQREKAYEYARDQACALLEIYAQRDQEQGFAYKLTDNYVDFCEAFPFEETPDQQRAINEVLKDMQSIKPMDRLV